MELVTSGISTLASAANEMRAAYYPRNETERKVFEALSTKNWGASTTLMNDIASDTMDYEKYSFIMKTIWGTLDSPTRSWKQIFKALTLIEFLVKNGAERVIEEARDHIHTIRPLQDFNYYEGTTDKGSGVREKAKQLLELLSSNETIRNERDKARKLRDKFIGISNTGGNVGFGGGGNSYGGSENSGASYSGGGSSSYSGGGIGSSSYSSGGIGSNTNTSRYGGGSYDASRPGRYSDDSSVSRDRDRDRGDRHQDKYRDSGATDKSRDRDRERDREPEEEEEEDLPKPTRTSKTKKEKPEKSTGKLKVTIKDIATAPTPVAPAKPAPAAPAVEVDLLAGVSSSGPDLFAPAPVYTPAPQPAAPAFDPFGPSSAPAPAAAPVFDPFASAPAPTPITAFPHAQPSPAFNAFGNNPQLASAPMTPQSNQNQFANFQSPVMMPPTPPMQQMQQPNPMQALSSGFSGMSFGGSAVPAPAPMQTMGMGGFGVPGGNTGMMGVNPSVGAPRPGMGMGAGMNAGPMGMGGNNGGFQVKSQHDQEFGDFEGPTSSQTAANGAHPNHSNQNHNAAPSNTPANINNKWGEISNLVNLGAISTNEDLKSKQKKTEASSSNYSGTQNSFAGLDGFSKPNPGGMMAGGMNKPMNAGAGMAPMAVNMGGMGMQPRPAAPLGMGMGGPSAGMGGFQQPNPGVSPYVGGMGMGFPAPTNPGMTVGGMHMGGGGMGMGGNMNSMGMGMQQSQPFPGAQQPNMMGGAMMGGHPHAHGQPGFPQGGYGNPGFQHHQQQGGFGF